jgi:hypothetical protein
MFQFHVFYIVRTLYKIERYFGIINPAKRNQHHLHIATSKTSAISMSSWTTSLSRMPLQPNHQTHLCNSLDRSHNAHLTQQRKPSTSLKTYHLQQNNLNKQLIINTIKSSIFSTIVAEKCTVIKLPAPTGRIINHHHQ